VEGQKDIERNGRISSARKKLFIIVKIDILLTEVEFFFLKLGMGANDNRLHLTVLPILKGLNFCIEPW
jgi:hypothetical protein